MPIMEEHLEYNCFGQITVIISRGTKNSTLPDYTGKEYRQVEIDLGKLGVEYREEWEFNEEVEKKLRNFNNSWCWYKH